MASRSSNAKRATNVMLSADVLFEAKALGLNISQVCDGAVRERVRAEKQRRWYEDNAAFIAAYNATVAADGLPLDAWRTF